MKRFEIHVIEDGRVHFAGRPSDWAEFAGILHDLVSCEEGNQVNVYVCGNKVTIDQALEAAYAERDARIAKREENYTQISWLQGACENTRRTVWIRNDKVRNKEY